MFCNIRNHCFVERPAAGQNYADLRWLLKNFFRQWATASLEKIHSHKANVFQRCDRAAAACHAGRAFGSRYDKGSIVITSQVPVER